MADIAPDSDARLDSGGFERMWIVGQVAALVFIGYGAGLVAKYFADRRDAPAPRAVNDWQALGLAAVALAVFVVLAARLWSQITTRFTTHGVSQWHFFSRKFTPWSQVARIYYSRKGLVVEGPATIAINPQYYRRPDQMIRLVHSRAPETAMKPPVEALLTK